MPDKSGGESSEPASDANSTLNDVIILEDADVCGYDFNIPAINYSIYTLVMILFLGN